MHARGIERCARRVQLVRRGKQRDLDVLVAEAPNVDEGDLRVGPDDGHDLSTLNTGEPMPGSASVFTGFSVGRRRKSPAELGPRIPGFPSPFPADRPCTDEGSGGTMRETWFSEGF